MYNHYFNRSDQEYIFEKTELDDFVTTSTCTLIGDRKFINSHEI